MVKRFTLIIIVLFVTMSCTTTAARNLQSATRASANASFAFDTATRDFSEAVNNFRNAVSNFEFAIRDLTLAKTNSETIRARDSAFHANITARNAQKSANLAYNIASNAYEESIRSGLDFRRAQQELIISSDPWENNSSIRNASVRSNNISVDVHNTALTQFQSTERLYVSVFESYNQSINSWNNALEIHGLASMPDELFVLIMPIFNALYESDEFANADLVELMNTLIDIYYESNE